MTRPRIPRKPASPHGAFWAEPWELSAEDRQCIEAAAIRAGVSLSGAFFEAVLDIGAEYRAQLGRPSPGAVKDALRRVAEQANTLRETLDKLDYLTRATIEGTRVFPDGPFPFVDGLEGITRDLRSLEQVAQRAHSLQPARTREPDHAKAWAARRLRRVFDHHRLPFTAYDRNADHDSAGGLAAICLRAVLGVANDAYVGRWLNNAL